MKLIMVIDFWQIAWKPMGVNLVAIVIIKLCSAFPKQMYVLNLCFYIRDPKWEKFTKFQEEINSLTSISNQFKNQIWVKLTRNTIGGF